MVDFPQVAEGGGRGRDWLSSLKLGRNFATQERSTNGASSPLPPYTPLHIIINLLIWNQALLEKAILN